MRRGTEKPWCVVVADKIVARYAYQFRAEREAERMRRTAIRDKETIRAEKIPATQRRGGGQ